MSVGVIFLTAEQTGAGIHGLGSSARARCVRGDGDEDVSLWEAGV